jgi:L-asparaginase
MFSSTSLLLAFTALGYASPIIYRQEQSPFVFTNSDGLNFTQMNSSLPNVTIFATGKPAIPSRLTRATREITNSNTGGTIAGSSSSNTATTGYTAGALGILTLLDAVPEVLNISNVAGVQISNVGSPDVTSSILVSIAHQINNVVCNDPTMAGAVVTHGTDTLEETAFFLDATVNCGKPVIIVGAMRPATAISADGPFNLLEAVAVAINPASRNRGAMVVMNDRIVSAYYVTKTNANTMDTFKAYEQGNLGSLISNIPYFFYPPVTPTGKVAYDIRNVTAIPRVDILMSYQDMSNDTLYNAVASGAKGIVVRIPHPPPSSIPSSSLTTRNR